jgi:two-component system response regulator QseB
LAPGWRRGERRLESIGFDLMLAGPWDLPKRDGQAVLRELRARGNATPVIVLTARDELHHRVRRLERGCRRLHREAIRSG